MQLKLNIKIRIRVFFLFKKEISTKLTSVFRFPEQNKNNYGNNVCIVSHFPIMLTVDLGLTEWIHHQVF